MTTSLARIEKAVGAGMSIRRAIRNACKVCWATDVFVWKNVILLEEENSLNRLLFELQDIGRCPYLPVLQRWALAEHLERGLHDVLSRPILSFNASRRVILFLPFFLLSEVFLRASLSCHQAPPPFSLPAHVSAARHAPTLEIPFNGPLLPRLSLVSMAIQSRVPSVSASRPCNASPLM